MNSEIKNLVIKDISARVSYGVKFACNENVYTAKGLDLIVTDEGNWEYAVTAKDFVAIEIDFIKPYLFPLSSMTEEQCYELASIRSNFQDCWKYIKTPIPLSICNFEQIEWFHKNHFDYRGLIEKGLAIDATGLNIY